MLPRLKLTPEEFELEVKKNLDAAASGLSKYRSQHREVLAGADGEYEIGISVRFMALGAQYLTLVECKYCKRSIEREKVQSLFAKMQSIGAHKGIIFSTSGFQSGAVEFAEAHGIALVEFVDGRSSYIAKAFIDGDPLGWSQPDGVEGWLCTANHRRIVSTEHPEYLREFLAA